MNLVALIGRVFISLLFIWSGIGKIEDYSGTVAYISSAGVPFALVPYVVALVVELVVAPALLLGYNTNLAALVLSLFSLVAAVLFHLHPEDLNQITNFMKNITIAGALLCVFASGGGEYSLDNFLRRRQGSQYGVRKL